jgi:hypothetical protein
VKYCEVGIINKMRIIFGFKKNPISSVNTASCFKAYFTPTIQYNPINAIFIARMHNVSTQHLEKHLQQEIYKIKKAIDNPQEWKSKNIRKSRIIKKTTTPSFYCVYYTESYISFYNTEAQKTNLFIRGNKNIPFSIALSEIL